MRNLRSLILIIIILFQLSALIASPPDDGEGLTHFPSPDSGGVSASVASEEENIDSFDVNPKSGRWNVTSDNNTDDLVTDSILRMTTINNMTSDTITSAVGYEMNRGTIKTDGKVEYRMAASGGGNQTELFRDVYGDKNDFEEGDVEGWAHFFGQVWTSSADNGVWTLSDPVGAGSRSGWRVDDFDFSTTIGNKIVIKLKASEALRFHWRSAATAITSTQTASGEWEILEYTFNSFFTDLELTDQLELFVDEVSGDGNWEGDESFEIDYIEFFEDLDYATHVEDEIEDTWDWEVDNSTESWVGLGVGSLNVSEGFLRGTMDVGGAKALDSPAALNIDTNLFNIFIIRMNTSDITLDLIVQVDIVGVGLVNMLSTVDIDSTSQTIYTWDFSDDSDWTGTCEQIRLRWTEPSDFEGDEIIFIDYVLLLGHWDDSDSVIGLFDQDNLVPLLNVSTVFTSNNSHSTTSDKAYFTVELLDLDGDIAYSAISDNFTDISDLWIRGKITFDVLRSKITVTITADNTTRVDKWVFPADFTEESGRIPALFSHEKSPSVFTSTFCVATSWQELKLDYIKADYVERRWSQIDSPESTDWLADRWDFAYGQDLFQDNRSSYRLNVPYLDIVSASILANQTGAWNNAFDEAKLDFSVYGVDNDDGELHRLVQIQMTLDVLVTERGQFEMVINGRLVADTGATIALADPTCDFAISLSNDREQIGVRARVWKDPQTVFQDYIAENFTLTDFPDLSQEFVLEVNYTMSIVSDSEARLLFETFGFVQKDIFSDFVDDVIEKVSSFLEQLFIGLFNFVAGIFRIVGEFIVAGIVVMQDALTAAINGVTAAINQIQGWLTTLGTTITTAINQIQGWLTALGTTITTAIASIQGWLTTLGTTITTALSAIAADIWTAFGTAAGDIMDDVITALTALSADVADFFDATIQALLPLLSALAEDFSDLIVDIMGYLLVGLGTLVEAFVGLLASVVFWIWDALGLPDILAVLDVLLEGLGQFITNLPQFLQDWITFLKAISALFVILGFIWIFFVPLVAASTAGECLEKIIGNALTDISGGAGIAGFQVPIPFFIPWGLLIIWSMLADTIFFGFF